ncbi:hypothetical protein [Blastococcus aurantiacus]|uniref:hypothetical protein n=1 Tax=Blastococcus aurantiacus TaxID=1550231 RepID=UPI000B87A237|nr:hypothetical protein [Blastococcus aurantiacus]
MVNGTSPTEPQVERLAAFRARLSADGLTLAQLAIRRGDSGLNATAGWVAARRRERSLLACTFPDGSLEVPAFQLTDAGEVRSELRPLLERLLGAGAGDWTAWTWLTQPSSLLSGEVPELVAVADPERALRAAARYATESGG